MTISAVHPFAFGDKVCKAMGIDPNQVARIVIDADVRNAPVRIYVEMVASEKILDLDWSDCLRGAEIKAVDK